MNDFLMQPPNKSPRNGAQTKQGRYSQPDKVENIGGVTLAIRQGLKINFRLCFGWILPGERSVNRK